MKIQTTNLGKGGGGKTTDTFNEGGLVGTC